MRRIDTRKISKAECFSVQVNGLRHCENCKWRGISPCQGKEIVKSGYNQLGYKVSLNGLATEAKTI